MKRSELLTRKQGCSATQKHADEISFTFIAPMGEFPSGIQVEHSFSIYPMEAAAQGTPK